MFFGTSRQVNMVLMQQLERQGKLLCRVAHLGNRTTRPMGPPAVGGIANRPGTPTLRSKALLYNVQSDLLGQAGEARPKLAMDHGSSRNQQEPPLLAAHYVSNNACIM